MRFPTASSLGRATACAPSHVLPAVWTPPSSAASEGTGGHHFLQLIAEGSTRDHALAATSPEMREWCSKIDVRQVPLDGETEVAMAYDVVTGRARRLTISNREYGDLGPNEIAGTTDLLLGDPLEVNDWKFNRWGFDAESYRPQLELYSLMAARLRGSLSVQYRMGVVTEDGAIGWTPTVFLDWEDLAAIAVRVRRAFDRVRRAAVARVEHEHASESPWLPDVTEGPHCQYCDAVLACPAKRAAVGALLGVDPKVISPADVGSAWARAKAAEDMIERLKPLVKTLAEISDLPTGDGRVVRLDGKKALRVVRAA